MAAWHFLYKSLAIILIDLLLAGDNAVVIAMAARSLPRARRRLAILAGAGFAVALRVALTFFAAQLLEMRFVQLAGGTVILWIAVKLFSDTEDSASSGRQARGIWSAIRLIVVADLTMSTDNVLAIAAASKGSLFLLIFGLGLSIPFVVVTSTVLATLMDRFPVIVYLGAAVLGRVGGEMMMTDQFVAGALRPAPVARYAVEALCAAGVVASGLLRHVPLRAQRRRPE